MPLTDCRECGHEVSTEARMCPNCGVPDPSGMGKDLQTGICRACRRQITADYEGECPECGQKFPFLKSVDLPSGEESGSREELSGSSGSSGTKSDSTAGCLGLLLGPVGLWYKRQWAAGFAWLVMAIILGVASGGILAPFLWIGMAIHAHQAEVA